MTHFEHKPLDIAERQIRLLDLLPGSGVIKCHLRHVSLTMAEEKYEALSYCWGAPTTQQVKILVDDLVFFVTPNLHAALLRLRSLGTSYPRTLWVDAICIHQSDSGEKNAQIPLMGDIYSSCQRVIVWLGEHDSFTKPTFDGVKFMASRSNSGERFNYYDWRKVQRGEQPQGVLRRILPKSRVETLESGAGFSSVFSRPWFTRVWVIQELALGPHAIVVCGKFQIDWDLFAKAHSVSKSNFEVHNHLGTILRYRSWPSDLAHDIFDYVIMAWHKDATNPRDKIYGFIGLESMQNDDVPIEIDYEADVGQVFTHFTTTCLERTGNLQVLAICRGCKATYPAEPDYPSWAVDYKYDRNKEPLPYELISWGFNDWKAYPQGLNAGGNIPCKPSVAGKLLGLQGFGFDFVVGVSTINVSAPAQDRQTSVSGVIASWISAITFCSIYLKGGIASWITAINFCQFYLEAKKMCEDASLGGTYRPTGQTTLEAFWQVLRGRELPIDHQNTEASARKQFEGVDRLLSRQAGRAATVKSIVSITKAIIGEPSYIEFFSLIGITKQRRFLITEKGYMGLGPRETKVGDRIVILQGHRAPIIARHATSKHWAVVGDSYIHGIMEGEVFSQEKCELLWFE